MSESSTDGKAARYFFQKYSPAARRVDRSLIEDLGSDLEGLLIFSGLFSAVSTAFIVDGNKSLQPDYQRLTFYALMNTTLPYTPTTFVVRPVDRSLLCRLL
ncbi:hypothetical protein EXIGLDRAFT_720413, partial [Exidia glandulosa HHB12029]